MNLDRLGIVHTKLFKPQNYFYLEAEGAARLVTDRASSPTAKELLKEPAKDNIRFNESLKCGGVPHIQQGTHVWSSNSCLLEDDLSNPLFRILQIIYLSFASHQINDLIPRNEKDLLRGYEEESVRAQPRKESPRKNNSAPVSCPCIGIINYEWTTEQRMAVQ